MTPCLCPRHGNLSPEQLGEGLRPTDPSPALSRALAALPRSRRSRILQDWATLHQELVTHPAERWDLRYREWVIGDARRETPIPTFVSMLVFHSSG
jgi:hypothetical protein